MSLDSPEVVAREYATERGLESRRSIYAEADGPDPKGVLWQEISRVPARRVLEVGAGPGELSARIAGELGVTVVAVDLSDRMVELARGNGVDARVGDVRALELEDQSFDLVVAAWMLYHVPDLDRCLREIVRVLRPGGRLIAVTNSELHLDEIRVLGGVGMRGRVSFSRENGLPILRRHFAAVEQRDVDQWVTFPDAAAVRRYLESTIVLKEGATRVPELDGPVRAGARTAVFVAEKAA